MAKKCDYVCISKAEFDRLKAAAEKNVAGKPKKTATKKKTTAKASSTKAVAKKKTVKSPAKAVSTKKKTTAKASSTKAKQKVVTTRSQVIEDDYIPYSGKVIERRRKEPKQLSEPKVKKLESKKEVPESKSSEGFLSRLKSSKKPKIEKVESLPSPKQETLPARTRSTALQIGTRSESSRVIELENCDNGTEEEREACRERNRKRVSG